MMQGLLHVIDELGMAIALLRQENAQLRQQLAERSEQSAEGAGAQE